ncbi:hypothetical protein GCM10009804_32260 [Kribbella hippodromi]|uniref:Uncharacterized protein n=1 Tax=Kribbella hippodromi TaxID=434347 RepID=A0ABP4P4F1_9ACTN
MPRPTSYASGTDTIRYDEFARRYREELQQPERAQALEQLKKLAKGKLTLLTATKQAEISQAAVLADILK